MADPRGVSQAKPSPLRSTGPRLSLDRRVSYGDLGALLEATPLPGEPTPFEGHFREPTQRYRLIREIARGGMGAVWLARDRQLERDVALKVLHPGAQASADARQRFLYEAHTTGRLGHPGIIPVHDSGQLEDGRWFYTMRRISGTTLFGVLDGLSQADPEAVEAWNLNRLLQVFSRVCLTVGYAHDHGVMHRDLKPENVLLGPYGEVYVADWGLAKAAVEELELATIDPAHTTDGVAVGTPEYMSPEQVKGHAEAITVATDVWALGVMLFELLTLRLPFEAKSAMAVMVKIISHDVPDPRSVVADLPEPMVQLVWEALQRDPARRVLTAREMGERIERFLDGVEAQTRKKERAAELLERATALLAEQMELRAELETEAYEVRTVAAALPPGAERGAREALWAREQALAERKQEAEALSARVVQTAQASLDEWPAPATHDLLAELYWQRVEDATRSHDESAAAYFRTLVARHDQGRFAVRLSGLAELEVSCDAADATVRLERQRPFGPVLRSTEVELARSLPMGTYVVVAEAPGRMPARVPVLLQPGARREVRIELPVAFEGQAEFVYVAGGRLPVGGDTAAPKSRRSQRVEVDPFLMGRHPVTMGRYCAFINGIAAEGDPEGARAHAPRSRDGSQLYFDVDPETGRYSVPATDADGDPLDPDFPVMLVNWHDAVAYCRWRSERDGVEYRLPTEDEWEVAARGPDGRVFPWGNRFDASLCSMLDSRPGRPYPVPVGTMVDDCSPYGVREMAGSVVEWTSTPWPGTEGHMVMRAGAYSSPAAWCRAAARRSMARDWNASAFGFRIVRAVD